MTLILNGTSGITDVNGTAAAPAITGTDTDTGVFFGTNTVSLSTNGTERLQVDSSGNLGLGVTPSAWNSVYKGLQIGLGASFFGRTANSNVAMSANAFVNSAGNWQYINTEAASYYLQGGGAHYWSIAASGTAGNTITFTQAMTLDASGNLGIGTTSPLTRLDVSQANAKSATGIWQTQIFDSTSQTTGVGGGISFGGYKTAQSASEVFAGIDAYKENSTAGNAAGALRFHTQVSGGSGLVERARINSSGNLLVGTTTDLNNTTQGSITVGAGGTSASNCGQIQVNGSTASGYGAGLIGYSNGTNVWGVGTYGNFAGGTSTFLICKNTGGGVYLNGASATSWTAVSDETRKVIIEPITDAVNKVATLRTVIGRLKSDDETVRRPYLIAQDVQAVLPEAVSENEDAEGAVLGLSYTEVIPLLVAAIKEQQALITQLQADVAALKGQA